MIVASMTTSRLNQLSAAQLAAVAAGPATFIAQVVQGSARLELYYIAGHFIELGYYSKRFLGFSYQWRLCFANHFPNSPASTPYLTIYLPSITLDAGLTTPQNFSR